MSQDRGTDPTPPENQATDPTAPGGQAPEPTPPANREPEPTPPANQAPEPGPPQDDIRWLIYLAIGLVFFLALVAWSGFHNAMGH
jgi:hypothetical protein